MSTGQIADQNALAEYEAWRKNRWEEVAGSEGKSGITAFHRITEPGQVLPDFPGQWDVGASGALTLTAPADVGISFGGQLVDGTVEVPSGSRLELPGGRVGSVSGGGGMYGLVVWDPSAPTLTALRGIESYPFDPDWIVDAEYRRVPAGRATTVERLTNPRSSDSLSAPADLVFEKGGEQHTLLVVESLPNRNLVVFADSTSGDGTPEMGRWLILPDDSDGAVRIDFNRAILPYHVFSSVFPCPLPPAGNRLPLRVEAGERAPIHTAPE